MKNLVSALIVALVLATSAASAAEVYSYEYYDGDVDTCCSYDGDVDDYLEYVPPPSSEGFEWQGHDPVEEGWYASYGSMKNASLVHWQGGFNPIDGSHMLTVDAENTDATIVAKEFFGNAGDVVSLFWAAAKFSDYVPFMDSVFGYIVDQDGATKKLFSATILDGSSTWWNYAETSLDMSGTFTLYLGAMNAIDTINSPELLVDYITVYTPSFEKGFAVAPVPVPSAIWLLGSAMTGLVVRRRKAN